MVIPTCPFANRINLPWSLLHVFSPTEFIVVSLTCPFAYYLSILTSVFVNSYTWAFNVPAFNIGRLKRVFVVNRELIMVIVSCICTNVSIQGHFIVHWHPIPLMSACVGAG